MTTERNLENYKDLPDELFRVLGNVTARYGQLEYVITVTILRTTILSPHSDLDWERVFAEARKFKRKQAEDRAKEGYALLNLAQTSETEFVATLQRAKELSEKRDEITHCHWYVGKDGKLVRVRKGKAYPVDTAEIEQLGDDLLNVTEEINQFTHPERILDFTVSASVSEIIRGYDEHPFTASAPAVFTSSAPRLKGNLEEDD